MKGLQINLLEEATKMSLTNLINSLNEPEPFEHIEYEGENIILSGG